MAEAERPLAVIFHVKIEEGREGLFYATSPEFPGLLVAEEDLDSLLEEVPRVVEAMFKAQGKDVYVIQSGRPKDSETLAPPPWVAIPAQIAARANAG